MDTLLVAGDHYLGGRGLPVAVTGAEELIQRALIRLSVRRGSFSLLPSLGSELYKLKSARPPVWNRLAVSYAQEALSAMGGVTVEDAAVSRIDRDTLLVSVGIRYGGQLYPLEVELD